MKHIHLLSNQRSGSTYLYHVLRNYVSPNQQRFINQKFSFHEPFNISHAERYFEHDVINERIALLEKTEKSLVIKNHFNDLERLQRERLDIYKRFKSLDLYTIILIRYDLFEVALSYTIADQTGQWNIYTDIEPFFIDEQKFLSNLREITRRVSATLANKHGFRIDQTINYSDLTFIPRQDMKLIDLPGVHIDHDVIIDEVERSPDKRQIVTNYDSLRSIARSFLTKSQ